MANGNPHDSDDRGVSRDQSSAEQSQVAAAIQSLEGRFQSAREKPTQYEREAHTWAIRTGKGVIIYTILTAIIMVAAVCAAIFGKRQAEIADTTQKLQNRAFVFKRQIDLIPTLDDKGNVIEWRIAPLWENSGNTPTTTLKIVTDCPSGHFDFSGTPIECPLSNFLEARPYYSRFMGPHQQSHDEGGCTAMPPAEIAAIPDHRFFMFGYARYTDVFSEEHKTRFCQGIILSGDPKRRDGLAVESVIAQGGNCTDDVCDAEDRKLTAKQK